MLATNSIRIHVLLPIEVLELRTSLSKHTCPALLGVVFKAWPISLIVLQDCYRRETWVFLHRCKVWFKSINHGYSPTDLGVLGELHDCGVQVMIPDLAVQDVEQDHRTDDYEDRVSQVSPVWTFSYEKRNDVSLSQHNWTTT